VQEHVCDEAGKDDDGIKNVEFGVEISVWEVSVWIYEVVG